MPDSGKTARTTVWAIVVVFVATLGAVVLLAAMAPEGQEVDLVVQVLGTLAPVLAVLAAMRQVNVVGQRVDQVAQDTHDLTNGLLERKVRVATSEVLHDNLVDPAAADQVLEDRVVIQAREDQEGRGA